MTTENEKPLADHAMSVQAIAEAVAKLMQRFGPMGVTPEAVFEGAVKGAAAMIVTTRELSLGEVADLLEGMADGFRREGAANDDRPN